jgi:GGDEF domain-containing protein
LSAEATDRSPYKTAFEIGAALTANVELKRVLPHIARKVGEAMGSDYCDINTYDATTDSLTYAAVWGKRLSQVDKDYVGTVVALADRPTRREVLEGGKVVACYLDDPDLDDAERASMEQYGEHASLETPLIYGDEVLGLFGIVMKTPGHRFGDDEKAMLATLAMPAAVAIHNARVFGAAAARQRQLTSLLDAGKAVTGSFGLEDVLQTVAHQAADLLGCPECLIYEYDAERHTLVWRTRYDRGTGQVWEDPTGRTYPVKDWLDDPALLLSGEPMAQHRDDPSLTVAQRGYLTERGLETVLTVPLRYGDDPVGLLQLLEFGQQREFTDGELELATAFGELASAAVRSAQLLHRQERQSDRLVGLFDASRSMTTALTVDDVVRAVHDEVAGAMPGETPQVRVWLRGEDGAFAVHSVQDDGLRPACDGGPLPALLAGALARPAPVQHRAGAEARLIVPLAVRGEVEGFIDVTSRRRQYGKELVELFQIVANQAAAAVANAHLYSRLAMQAITDGLTGVYNHRYFYERLEQECARACRYGLPLSLLMIDIDDFKQFNDEHGHMQGDDVLRQVGLVLREGLRRGIDLPARYGGEEFAVILPHTEAAGAHVVSGRLQQQIACLGPLGGPDDVPPQGRDATLVGERLRLDITEHASDVVQRAAIVTVSVGIASVRAGELPGDELVHRADKALYVAKHAGKNRVEVYS